MDDPLLQSAFAQEMVKQLRALDSYDIYAKATPADLLEPFILTRNGKRKFRLSVIRMRNRCPFKSLL
jgi:hypothetical protein